MTDSIGDMMRYFGIDDLRVERACGCKEVIVSFRCTICLQMMKFIVNEALTLAAADSLIDGIEECTDLHVCDIQLGGAE